MCAGVHRWSRQNRARCTNFLISGQTQARAEGVPQRLRTPRWARKSSSSAVRRGSLSSLATVTPSTFDWIKNWASSSQLPTCPVTRTTPRRRRTACSRRSRSAAGHSTRASSEGSSFGKHAFSNVERPRCLKELKAIALRSSSVFSGKATAKDSSALRRSPAAKWNAALPKASPKRAAIRTGRRETTARPMRTTQYRTHRLRRFAKEG